MRTELNDDGMGKVPFSTRSFCARVSASVTELSARSIDREAEVATMAANASTGFCGTWRVN